MEIMKKTFLLMKLFLKKKTMKGRSIELNIIKSTFSYIKNSTPIRNSKFQKRWQKRMLELSKLQKEIKEKDKIISGMKTKL